MEGHNLPHNSPRRNPVSPNNSQPTSPNPGSSRKTITSQTFCSLNYAQYALNKMKNMQENHIKCDVTMMPSEDTDIPCHKVVLMAGSPYLESKLRNDDAKTLIVMDVTREAAILLVEYIYTGKLKLTMETVGQVLPAGALWQIEEIRGFCIEFLLNAVGTHNFETVMNLAVKYDMPEVMEEASTYGNLHRRIGGAPNQVDQANQTPENLLSED